MDKSIKSRIEKLESSAKQARNNQTTYTNYTAEQIERSKELLHKAIIKISNIG